MKKTLTIIGSIAVVIIWGLIIYAQLPNFFGSFITKGETKEQCSWDTIQSNAEMTGCLRNQKENLMRQREATFNSLMKLNESQIDVNVGLVGLESVQTGIKAWYEAINEFDRKYCEAYISDIFGSGQFEEYERCQIQLTEKEIIFIEGKTNYLKNYSKYLGE